MNIRSPLTVLVDTIREVLSAAQRHREVLRASEAATRAALIDPVLRALGWDFANTFMVEVEKRDGKTCVDYLFSDRNREEKVIVEAKHLGTPLDKEAIYKQLLTYAFQHGVVHVFVTDGIIWDYYTDFKPGSAQPSRRIDLSKEDVVSSGAFLVERLDAAHFWPESQDIDFVAQRVEDLESELRSLKEEVDQLRAMASAAGPGSLKCAGASAVGGMLSSEVTKDLHPLDSDQNLMGSRPLLLRLPTGRVVPVSTWKAVLVEACKEALALTPEIPVPLPDCAGKKVLLLSRTPPPKGLSHVSVDHHGAKVFIYTNYDANHCAMNASHVLGHIPTEKQIVESAVAYAVASPTDG